MRRGQASVTAIEAAVGVLLLTSVVVAFSLGGAGNHDAGAQAQLDAYASDAATLLSQEKPQHAEQTRLAELSASKAAFDREAAALERRLETILPENVLFRVETTHGSVGHPFPGDVPAGEATVPTVNGDVSIKVWHV
jgi:hypothetical protein